MRLRFKKRNPDSNNFLVFQMIISVLIIFFTITQQQSLSSLMFDLSFINLLLLYFTAFRRGKETSSGLLLIIWCAVAILFSYVAGSKSFSSADLVSFETFAATILFLQVVCCIDVTTELVHTVLFIGTASAALYPIGYYFLNANEFRRMGSLLLTMHFSSPNLTGFYIAQACMFSILCFFLTKKRAAKTVSIILFGFDFYFLILTGARNSLMSVIFVLAGIIFVKIKRIKKIHPSLTFIVSIFPLAFAVFYLLFIETVSATGTLDFIVEEGKPITSRFTFWKNVFRTLKGLYWLTGDFSKLRGNLHNTHVTVLGSYGIVGMILLIKFLNDVMNFIINMIKTESQSICLICFLGTLFMGNGEAALFYGSMGLYAIACSYLILARYDWDNEYLLTKNEP